MLVYAKHCFGETEGESEERKGLRERDRGGEGERERETGEIVRGKHNPTRIILMLQQCAGRRQTEWTELRINSEVIYAK